MAAPTPDPKYGLAPNPTIELWNQLFAGNLTIFDDEWEAWRAVISDVMGQFLQSQWQVRWRRALSEAEGVQLDEYGETFGYLRPDGFDDTRYRGVLLAIFAAALTYPTIARARAVADALLGPGQSYVVSEEGSLVACWTFFGTSQLDIGAFRSALEYARAYGVQFVFKGFDGPVADAFRIDISEIDGPDQIGYFIDP